MKPSPRKVHFIGIGGIGVSALAQWYLAEGWQVSGSDAARSEVTDFLASQGINVTIDEDPTNIYGVDLVIYSAAVKRGNPEFDEAKKLGIKTKLYAEAVGELTRRYDTIAIAGSHGKSTTTAMIAKILLDTGFDPTIIIGTKMSELEGNNFRYGHSKLLVLEADEYNRHFHFYYPKIAVILNIDREHLDVYGNIAEVEEAFGEFMENLSSEGVLIANGQDKSISKLLRGYHKGKRKIVIFNQTDIAKHGLKVIGQHNQSNAEAAFQATRSLNIAEVRIRASLKGFSGTWRRLEEIKPGVFSDYAHHPTEIRTTLEALKKANPKKRLICVFQPHQRDRLTKLFDEFVTAFEAADQTIIIPLYVTRGRDKGSGRSSEDLAETIRQEHVHAAPNFETAFSTVSDYFDNDHIVVFMGAGDIDNRLRNKLKLAA